VRGVRFEGERMPDPATPADRRDRGTSADHLGPRSSTSRLGHVTGDALDHALLAAAQLNHIAIGVAHEHGDRSALAKADRDPV
jgi:hypothetical protein